MPPSSRKRRPEAAAQSTEPLVESGRHREVFENARVALWDQDFSPLVARLAEMRAEGITDLHVYLEANPEILAELVRLVRVVDVNSYAVELFEAAHKEELLGTLGATFLPETTPVFLGEVEALWHGKRRFEGEAPVRTLRGRHLDVLLTIHWGGENAERSLVSILDISRQKAAQRDLSLLAAIVELSNDAIASKDLQGMITSWNKGAERLFGYTAAEIIGKSVTILIPPENHDEEDLILSRIRAGQPVDHYETIRVTKGGQLIDISLTVSRSGMATEGLPALRRSPAI